MPAHRVSSPARASVLHPVSPFDSSEGGASPVHSVMPRRPVPPVLRLIWADWWALVSAATIVLPWLVPVAVKVFGDIPNQLGQALIDRQVTSFLAGMSLVFCLAGATALVFRLRRLRRFFTRGVELPGVIEESSFFHDRGQVFFSYQFKHRRYQSSMALHDTRMTRMLQPGRPVRVLVDPRNPNRAILPLVFGRIAHGGE